MTCLAASIKPRNMWQVGKLCQSSGPDVAGKSIVALAEIVKTSSVVAGLNELNSRYGTRSDGEMAAGLIQAVSVNIVNDVDTLVEIWGRVVDAINVPLYEEWEKDTKIALDHVKDRLKYIRLDENGPKLGEISTRSLYGGDCVKLRYGILAATFDGFRINNCHSIPAHVGVAMLDAARLVNPDLYVCTELFTGSEEMDLLFLQRLGINSLVREAGNAWDPKEFSRVIVDVPIIGSMDRVCSTSMEELDPAKGPARPCIVSPLNGSVPHALMYDLTHDNESYLDKRSAEHALSVVGIVTFGYCAVASVKGFDDLYPKLLNLV
ncbi:hypothetical protein EDB19DRAFT_1928453 [Suillus lakei]|nr:hypothetical protein EDB19DRAFT_1928453 [Suillus lakei]